MTEFKLKQCAETNPKLYDAITSLRKAIDDFIPTKTDFGRWIVWQELCRQSDGGKYTFKSPKRMVSNRTKKKQMKP